MAPSHLSDGTMVVVRRIPTTAGATAPHGIERSEAQVGVADPFYPLYWAIQAQCPGLEAFQGPKKWFYA